MKKFFIILFTSLFLIAIAMRSCSNDESYDEEEEFTTEETNSNKENLVDISSGDEEKTTKPDPLLSESNQNNNKYGGDSFEIPRLMSSKPEQILVREGYTTSYNKTTKNANWVAWHLTREHTNGEWSRDGIPYYVDEEVNGERQELEDWYSNTLPIDHGHMCPAGDCKWSKKAMHQSFLLTNMCPQNSKLNSGDWEELERRCRGWARHFGEIYITCGPIFYGSNYQTIGANKVGVPDAFYKVVLCLSPKPMALGFIYPNNGIHHNMDYYVTSVDNVEETTGIDFFYNVSEEIENLVESSYDIKKW